MAFLSVVGARYDASFDYLNNQRAFCAIAHIDLGPLVLRSCILPFVDTSPRTFRVTTATLALISTVIDGRFTLAGYRF